MGNNKDSKQRTRRTKIEIEADRANDARRSTAARKKEVPESGAQSFAKSVATKEQERTIAAGEKEASEITASLRGKSPKISRNVKHTLLKPTAKNHRKHRKASARKPAEQSVHQTNELEGELEPKDNMGRVSAERGASRSSADAPQGTGFGAVVPSQNESRDSKDNARGFTSDVFRKTAALLCTQFNQRNRVVNAASTTVSPALGTAGADPHSAMVASLKWQLSLRENSCHTAGPQKRQRDPAAEPLRSSPAKHVRVLDQAAALRTILPRPPALPSSPALEAPAKHPKRPGQKFAGSLADPRCKRCGRLKKSDPLSLDKHGKRVAKSSSGYCRVPVQSRLPGFPLAGYEVSNIA